MTKITPTHKAIIRFARSRGFLSPLWLLPTSSAKDIQRAFQDLESFLRNAYINREIEGIGLKDINDFIWKLKKQFAFKGWEGIAPLLLSPSKIKDEPRKEPRKALSELMML